VITFAGISSNSGKQGDFDAGKLAGDPAYPASPGSFQEIPRYPETIGRIFIEDTISWGSLAGRDNHVREMSSARTCFREEYKRQLAENGFTGVEFADKTACWSDFVRDAWINLSQTARDTPGCTEVKPRRKEDF
jgi:hypothetical protein